MASMISGRSQAKLLVIYNRQVFKTAYATLDCQDNPLKRAFELLPSGWCFRAPVLRTKRLYISFIPGTIDMLLGCIP